MDTADWSGPSKTCSIALVFDVLWVARKGPEKFGIPIR